MVTNSNTRCFTGRLVQNLVKNQQHLLWYSDNILLLYDMLPPYNICKISCMANWTPGMAQDDAAGLICVKAHVLSLVS